MGPPKKVDYKPRGVAPYHRAKFQPHTSKHDEMHSRTERLYDFISIDTLYIWLILAKTGQKCPLGQFCKCSPFKFLTSHMKGVYLWVIPLKVPLDQKKFLLVVPQ